MNRLEMITPKQWDETIKNGTIQQVKCVVEYLMKRGHKVRIYKDILRPSYILEVKDNDGKTLTLKYKNGVELLNDLKEPFFNAREQYENEIMRKKMRKEMRAILCNKN